MNELVRTEDMPQRMDADVAPTETAETVTALDATTIGTKAIIGEGYEKHYTSVVASERVYVFEQKC
jgi:hypothetical protein